MLACIHVARLGSRVYAGDWRWQPLAAAQRLLLQQQHSSVRPCRARIIVSVADNAAAAGGGKRICSISAVSVIIAGAAAALEGSGQWRSDIPQRGS